MYISVWMYVLLCMFISVLCVHYVLYMYAHLHAHYENWTITKSIGTEKGKWENKYQENESEEKQNTILWLLISSEGWSSEMSRIVPETQTFQELCFVMHGYKSSYNHFWFFLSWVRCVIGRDRIGIKSWAVNITARPFQKVIDIGKALAQISPAVLFSRFVFVEGGWGSGGKQWVWRFEWL